MIRLLEAEDLDDVAEIWLILEFQKISFRILTKMTPTPPDPKDDPVCICAVVNDFNDCLYEEYVTYRTRV